ncbi:MAG: PAS domain S-box protein [Candidatus Omnitrophica bacterium]|nr:PAS domain S-box protein [Candidatus Omnitrophota bacterium]
MKNKKPLKKKIRSAPEAAGKSTALGRERKLVEALRKSEERFQQIAANAEEWIWEVDAAGLYTYASPVLEKILGYKPEEVIGKKYFYDLFVPEIRNELKKAALEGFACKEPFKGFVNANVHKDGRRVVLETSGTPILNDQGDLLGYRGADFDVTARIRAEEVLRASERSYREQFSKNAAVMLLIDPTDGKIIDANEAAIKFYGYSRARLLEMRISDINALPLSAVQHAMSEVPEEKGRQFQFQHRLADGALRDVEVSSSRIQFGDRSLLHSIIFDITARKQMKAELIQSRLLYAETASMGKVGGWEFDIDTGRQKWTDEMYRILEVPFDFGPTVEKGLEFYSAVTRPVIENAVQRAIAFGEACDLEVPVITGKGNHRIVHIIGKADLAARRIYGFYHDVTERKQAEDTLKSLNENLEQRVNERTQQITDQSMKIQEMYAELTHMGRVAVLGQLSAALAHEINQPLGTILNSASAAHMILTSKDPDIRKVQEILEHIIAEDERAGSIIRGIRDLVRKEAGEHVRVDMQALIQETVKLISNRFTTKGVNLVLDIQADERMFFGNKIQLQQVLLNLLANAFEALNEVSLKKIVIKMRVLQPGQLTVSVFNNGPKISAAIMAQMFKPFKTTKKHGFGVGLFICRSIIQAHGGKLSVDNNADEGVTVSFDLPLLEDGGSK